MKILFVFGTRPEAIKFAPLIKEFDQASGFKVCACVTAQHREMLDQVLDFFSIRVDHDLNLMKANQTLTGLSSRILTSLDEVVSSEKPDLIFVQGDTTTAFMGALTAFYHKIKVAHLEAGLRSFDIYSPFPEEANRLMISKISNYHFAPTEKSVQNLSQEGIRTNVYKVGNTVIDSLLLGLDLVKRNGEDKYLQLFDYINFEKKIILVTAHRRESFGDKFLEICKALREIASDEDVQVVFPLHFNPNIRDVARTELSGVSAIHLIDPLAYPELIWLMNKSYLVLTDSGGIQEEAPTLGKPVLVMRDVTEREEGIEAGTALLVGSDRNVIVTQVKKLIENPAEYDKIAKAVNPYGDGTTSKKIVEFFSNFSTHG